METGEIVIFVLLFIFIGIPGILVYYYENEAKIKEIKEWLKTLLILGLTVTFIIGIIIALYQM